jgi:hypothetical protein
MYRRNFLKKLGILTAGAIVAPTLAEVVVTNAKKYFFIRNNPFGGTAKLWGMVANLDLNCPRNQIYLINIELHPKQKEMLESFDVRYRLFEGLRHSTTYNIEVPHGY